MADVTISQLQNFDFPSQETLIPVSNGIVTYNSKLSSFYIGEEYDLLQVLFGCDAEGFNSTANTSGNSTGASLTNKIWMPSQGGNYSYSIVNGTLRMDYCGGSQSFQAGRLYLPKGIYRLSIQTKPSETTQVWNSTYGTVQGFNTSDHYVRIAQDDCWTSPSANPNGYQYLKNIIAALFAPRARASTSYGAGVEPFDSRKKRSSLYYTIFTIASDQFVRVVHQTNPYSAGTPGYNNNGVNGDTGGYKYFIESLKLTKFYNA